MSRHPRQDDVANLDKMLPPNIRTPETHEQIGLVASRFPEGQAATIETVSLRKTALKPAGQPAETRADIDLQYSFPHRWLLVRVSLAETNGTLAVAAVRVHPLAAPLRVINRFALMDKPSATYLFPCLAIAVPVVMAYPVYLCIRTGKGRKKWLCAAFILLGFCQMTLNRTTGAAMFNPFAIDILGSRLAQFGLCRPWMISASIPVGAIAFLAWGCRQIAATRR